ncbi:bifunctional 5,10-methylenetetrahydrofolate dehydrogenase/5,10-methenyltetrahydrofolate cyclohydrolase [Anaerovorax odorimutans]|uniref:Bifunctional protein FolD n=1 Tax=Anaerovorax odorimutans TaxID=109327 RepID=A0ABT1RTS2_9FIRM|nr:bifunctional 5,10-methylenetetrahydrofolate dehydrogenase/5,10-methenyltetrahydrofolate cyclohydrolase [Anaerovorax odorimutans]MCQ4638231.1 bifunctional 5,10-methylenetetrahydrofolate dehydrogenase/5,10-methenyltetrahydrofolate cyclohydrolase [Anaerovorax odorimutans]
MTQLLKGKEVADALTERLQNQTAELQRRGVKPCLTIVRVGENDSDLSYERGAMKRAEKVGVTVKQYIFEETISQEELLGGIEEINEDASIHGVLIFQPLPKQIDDAAVRKALRPEKDVDGITEGSLAGIFTGTHRGFAPCTARACMEILDHYGIDLIGKRVAVLGRSLVIGKPVAMMVMEKNGTVTVCHSKTGKEAMIEICQNSDVLIAAMGRAAMIDKSYVKAGQTVIDVGINVNEEGKLCGDVDFDSVSPLCGAITPVPGGVGAVTTAVLMLQVIEAAKLSV